MSLISVVFVTIVTTVITMATIAYLLLHKLKRYFMGDNAHTQFSPWQTKRHRCRKNSRWPLRSGNYADLDAWLNLNDKQQSIYSDLVDAFVEAKQQLGAYMPGLRENLNAPQKLNRWEDFISDALIIFQRLKPQLLAFYTSLSSEQQNKLDSYLNGPSHRCGWSFS